MNRLIIPIFFIAFMSGCDEPVPVDDVYQNTNDQEEKNRQEKVRVGSDGLTATGCPSDDTKCLAEKSQQLLDEMEQ